MHVYSSDSSRVPMYTALPFVAILLAMAANAAADAAGLGPAWLVSAPTMGGVFALLYRFVNTVA